VQLPFAGIENFVHLVDHDREWTCAKGVYAEPVAEMALTLALAGLRGFGTYARAHDWTAPQGRNLLGANVTVLGGGGITESLVRLLQPWDCHITVVRRTAHPLEGVDDVLEADRYADALPGADLVVLGAVADRRDRGDHRRRRALVDGGPRRGWSTSPAGRHVVTERPRRRAARRARSVVPGSTSPTPSRCRTTIPLWSLPNCLITPHVGNTPAMAQPLLAERIRANVRRFAEGDPLLGPIDADAGY
jgi:phosphoglycerate dehydrogenase-like enzyme